MERIDITKRDVLFLGIISVVAAVICTVWLALTGNTAQVYKDIVIEWTAIARSNKGTEILLLRLLIGAGSIGVIARLLVKKEAMGNPNQSGTGEIKADLLLPAWICAVVLLKFLLFGQTGTVFLFALAFICLAFIIDRTLVVSTAYCYFVSYYAFFALYQCGSFAANYIGPAFFRILEKLNTSQAYIFAGLCTGIPLCCRNRARVQRKLILLVQVLLPALFLILSVKTYRSTGRTAIIGIPHTAKLFIAGMIAGCLASTLKTLAKGWRTERTDMDSIIPFGTCLSILCFNMADCGGAVLSGDLHHPFENIFAFQQIFELGQVPYKDFIPPSGLYSVVHGLFFRLFGNGNVAYLPMSNAIYFMTVGSLSLSLLHLHISKRCGRLWCFAVALLLVNSGYNRTMFIAPVALLLLLPPLVRRRSLWLQVFLFANLFHGLYYPVYGVATAVGFLPLFCIQAKRLFTEDRLLFKKPLFWISWGLTLLVVGASFPLLWGTFIHIKAMAEQSVLADGISVFGQTLPNWFMPWTIRTFRYPLYNALHFVPLGLMIWLPVMLLGKQMLRCPVHARMSDEQLLALTLCLSLVLIPLVGYTFSFVRVDVNTFFARSWHVFANVLILYVVFFARHLRRNASGIATVCLMSLFIVMSFATGVDKVGANRMLCTYSVPDGYRLVDHSDVPTVDKCFLPEWTVQELERKKNWIQNSGINLSAGMLGYFGYYYMLRAKGTAGIEPFIPKCFDAAKETRGMLLRHDTAAVGAVGSYGQYYLYKYLVTSGEYAWDKEKGCFFKASGKLDANALKHANGECPGSWDGLDVGTTADVFGLSFKTLKKIFTPVDVHHTVSKTTAGAEVAFDSPLVGSDMDFMYVEFAGAEKEQVFTEFDMGGEHKSSGSRLLKHLFLKNKPNPDTVLTAAYYDDEGQRHTVHCWFGHGKLLVNLGAGMKYLLNNHRTIELSVSKNGETLPLPSIQSLQFLKCRQIW